MSALTEIWRILGQARASSRSGMVSVTTSSSSSESVDAGDRRAREHGVGAIGEHAGGAVLFERLGGLAQRAGGVDDVVHDDAGTPLDFADDVHHLRDVGLGTALVDDGEVAVEPLGKRAGAHDAADVGRDDHEVLIALFSRSSSSTGVA